MKNTIYSKETEIKALYNELVKLEWNRKEFALKYKNNPNFHFVMALANGAELRDIVIDYITDKTKRLEMARSWLYSQDPSFDFSKQEPNIE